VRTTEPELLVIVKEPEVAPPEKSEALMVPETVFKVQYNVVPLTTLVVLIVKVTDEPSLTDAVEGDIEYILVKVSDP